MTILASSDASLHTVLAQGSRHGHTYAAAPAAGSPAPASLCLSLVPCICVPPLSSAVHSCFAWLSVVYGSVLLPSLPPCVSASFPSRFCVSLAAFAGCCSL
ncbi:hypothetical protein ABPG77_006921 [Micractinium sp. CCAP 211/92]